MKLLELFLNDRGLVKQHIESFDDFINNKIDNIIKSIGPIETTSKNCVIELKNNICHCPTITESNGDTYELLPKEARIRNMTYMGNLYSDIHIKINDKEDVLYKTNIGSIPIMIGSSLCNQIVSSCPYDPQGYFIITGSEKVVISQEKMVNNEFFIFEKRNAKYSYEGEIRCLSENTIKSTTTIRLGITKDYKQLLKLNLPYMKSEIPAFLIFRYFNFDYNKDYYLKEFPFIKNSIRECEEIDNVQEYFIKHSLYKDNPDYITYQLNNYFLQHTKHPMELYQYIIEKISRYHKYQLKEDDRDHLKNKRIDTVGNLLSTLFRQLYKKFVKDIQVNIQKHEINSSVLLSIIKPKIITNGLKYALATGNWGINANFRTGVSQVLNRHSYMSTLSHLRRINSPLGKEGKMITPRQLHGSHAFRICPCETPEGHACGLVKNMALTCIISQEVSSSTLKSLILQNDVNHNNKGTPVFVNGDFLGNVKESQNLIDIVKDFRKDLRCSPEISICHSDNEIKIYTDGGRCLRPLINLKYIDNYKEEFSWYDCILNGVVEYLDCSEEENALIAFNDEDRINRKLNFTHQELDPSAMLGITASTIPFAEHNQAPRNVYQSAMGKQAMGMFATDHNERFDTFSHNLHYPQVPLVKTDIYDTMNLNEMPNGMNVVVAIMCYSGYNQEDSIIMSQSAIDRGLFRSTFYRTYKEEQNFSSTVKETIEKPDKKNCNALKFADYSKLENDGVVALGVKVDSGDVLVGKTIENYGIESKKDASLTVKHNENGYVDKVMVSTNEQGLTIVKTKLRTLKIPEVGDKFASRAAQKGTIGMTYRQEDMPFTAQGIIPDIIVNPHAIPSRMTVGQLIECIYSKYCASEGIFGDGTIFTNPDPNYIADKLESIGFNRHGEEVMYHGHTGEMLNAKIFIGPTYYQRLKHMVSDKVHSRARGPLQILTRQPVEGRARDGGLRFGEMEKDCIVSHGASFFLKERLLDQSDAFITHVCSKCGLFAIHNFETGESYCKGCDTRDVNEIKIPYACKLLFQELESMNVVPRIYCKDN